MKHRNSANPVAESHTPRSTAILAYLVLVGLCLRLLWLLVSQPDPVSDFQTYRRLALGLVEHSQFGYPTPTSGRLPGYPLFLAAFAAVSDHGLWLSTGSVLLSTSLVPLTHHLLLRLGAERHVALLGAALVTFNPTFILSAPLLASEHLATPLLVVAIAFALRSDPAKKLPWEAMVAGVVLGFAALTRGDTTFYVLVLGFIVARKGAARRRLTQLGAVLLGMMLVLAPWYVRNRTVVGAGTGLSTTAGFNFYAAHNEDGYGWRIATERLGKIRDPVQQNKTGWQLGLAYVKRSGLQGLAKSVVRGTSQLYLHPPKYAAKWSTEKTDTGAERFRPQLNLLASVYYYLLFLLAVVAYRWWRSTRQPVLALCAAVVATNWFTFAVVFWGKPRYRYIGELMFCLLAAVAIERVIAWQKSARTTRGDAAPSA